MEIEFDPSKYLHNPAQLEQYNRFIKSKVLSKCFWCNMYELREFPCLDVLRQHHLENLIALDDVIFPNLVKVFYTNLHYPSETSEGLASEVNGVSLSITPAFINRILHTSRSRTVKASAHRQFRNLEGITEQQVMDYVLKDALVPHSYPHIHVLKKVDLGFNMQVFTEIVQSTLLPRKGHVDTVNLLDIWVMGALGLGIPLDIGYLICQYMYTARIHPQQSLPFGILLSHIFDKQQVPISDDEPSIELTSRNHINLATFYAKHWEKVDGQWRIKAKRGQGEASSSKRPRTSDTAAEDVDDTTAAPDAAGPSGTSSLSHLEERMDLMAARVDSISETLQSLGTTVETSFQTLHEKLDRRLDMLERKLDAFLGDA